MTFTQPFLKKFAQSPDGLSKDDLEKAVADSLAGQEKNLSHVLIIPPDYTRLHSGAGLLTALYYERLQKTCKVDILPALGTHEPMTQSEYQDFFGPDVPFSAMITHNWRTDVVKLGEVPADFVYQVSEGLMEDAIDVEINKHLL
nr:DUF2088 domain-containing protein [Clostridia bacterium]